jgi:hypothetical protein
MFGSHAVRTGMGAAVAASLFLISLLYLTLCMDRSVGVYDEGIMLFGADRVLHGAVPHRGFYALYGPAQFYVLAGLCKVIGTSVPVRRAGVALLNNFIRQICEPVANFGANTVLRTKPS